jgi:hypothetical protein
MPKRISAKSRLLHFDAKLYDDRPARVGIGRGCRPSTWEVSPPDRQAEISWPDRLMDAHGALFPTERLRRQGVDEM